MRPGVEVRVTGARQLERLGLELKAAGVEGKGLRRNLLASLRVAAQPLAQAAKDSALEKLPKSGGLNEYIANSNIVARTRLTGPRVGVRIVAKKSGGSKGHDLEAMDAGKFRHPVYGRKGTKWQEQSVEPGWFSEPMKKSAPEMEAAALLALEVTARELAK